MGASAISIASTLAVCYAAYAEKTFNPSCESGSGGGGDGAVASIVRSAIVAKILTCFSPALTRIYIGIMFDHLAIDYYHITHPVYPLEY